MNQLNPTPARKAIALLSGGLDSLLAAKLVLDQGVEVTGLHLLSPFGCREDVQKVADALGIPLLFKEKGPAYLDLVQNPRFGYGKNMNPCIDCRVFMFQLADVVRQERGADFIVTGEVVGQRPMSQHRQAFALIDSNSPVEGLVLRPLSAQTLEPTLPEKMGWVRREEFLKISGRGRKAQLDLAEKYGLTAYSAPAGGCLLTDANFSGRLRDFFEGPTFADEEQKLGQSELLSVGRYFRLNPKTRIALGRKQAENQVLKAKAIPAGGVVIDSVHSGPTAVIFGEASDEAKHVSAALICYFTDTPTTEAEFLFGPERISYRSSRVIGEDDIKRMRVGVN